MFPIISIHTLSPTLWCWCTLKMTQHRIAIPFMSQIKLECNHEVKEAIPQRIVDGCG